ncbi:MAG: hypothetical protein HW389_1790 [Bacteroidetes bacterium]|nr:hypothetical protein [Bacteroidota bacterium]
MPRSRLRVFTNRIMLHSYTRIFVHLVWSTKHREPLLTDEVRPRLRQHLISNAEEKRIAIDTLAVQIEHVHALVILPSNQTVESVVRLLKGESSHWMNSENLAREKFSWQRGYGAFSVSLADIGAVRTYIRNQDDHHREEPFAAEFQTTLSRHGIAENGQETDEE